MTTKERNTLYASELNKTVLGVPVTDTIQYLTPPRWNITPHDYHTLLQAAYREQQAHESLNEEYQTKLDAYNRLEENLNVYGLLLTLAAGIAGGFTAWFTNPRDTVLGLVVFGPMFGVLLGMQVVSWLGPQHPTWYRTEQTALQKLKKLHALGGLLLPVHLLNHKDQTYWEIHNPHSTYYHAAYDMASLKWANRNRIDSVKTIGRALVQNHDVTIEWENLILQFKQHDALKERLATVTYCTVDETVKEFNELYLEGHILLHDMKSNNRVVISEQNYIRFKTIVNKLKKLSVYLNNTY